jgi:hypothetical protein
LELADNPAGFGSPSAGRVRDAKTCIVPWVDFLGDNP